MSKNLTKLVLPGLSGESKLSNGVQGTSESAKASGVFGTNTGGGFGVAGYSEGGIGVLGTAGSKWAGFFDGNVEVVGQLTINGKDVLAKLNELNDLNQQLRTDFEQFKKDVRHHLGL